MNDEIDRVLSSEDAVVPSSGFASSVMEAVKRESKAPPPIPFPWKRALPGLIYCTGALVAFLVPGFSRHGGGTESSGGLTRILELANDAGAQWIAVALVVSLVSIVVSMRMVGRRTF
jgi:hypothetical protein